MGRPSDDALLISADLLLTYAVARVAAYESIGVLRKEIEPGPYYEWLPKAFKCELEEASAYQVSYEDRLATKLFTERVVERSALDLVHLFVESGARVWVRSVESPDALAAIIARVGLPNSINALALSRSDRTHEFVSQILNSGIAPSFLLVYEMGLTPKSHQRIIDAMEGRGVLVNINGKVGANVAAEDHLLDLVNERWSYG